MLEVIFGFIFGVLASWIFWRYLLFLKPNLEIPQIIEEVINDSGNKEYIYRIRNLGKRQIVDISIRVTICEYTGEDTEYPLRLVHRLKVDLDEADVLYPVEKKECPDYWKPVSYRGFHIQQVDYNTNEPINIRHLLTNENRRLIVTIRASDSISRTTVVTRTTYTPNEILDKCVTQQP